MAFNGLACCSKYRTLMMYQINIREWPDVVGVKINLFLVGSSHEIQTAIVTERTPLHVNYHLTDHRTYISQTTIDILHWNTAFPLLRFKPRFSVFLQIFLSVEGGGCLAEGRESLTSTDCSQCGCFTVSRRNICSFITAAWTACA